MNAFGENSFNLSLLIFEAVFSINSEFSNLLLNLNLTSVKTKLI
jgi:hypothetical protein